MEPSSVQGGVGGCSINDVVGDVRVSEGNETVIGINLGSNNEVSRLDVEVDESCGRNLDELSGDRYLESNVMSDCKEEKVVVSNHIGDDSNAINLVVDLNLCRVADGERKSQNGIGNIGSEVRNISGDLADNVVCINGDDPDELIKEQATCKKAVNLADVKPECCGNERRIEKEGEFYGSDLVWAKVRSHPWWPGQIFDPSDASEKAMKHFKKDSFLVAYFGDQSFAWNDAARIKPFRMHLSQMEKQSSTESFCHAVNCALDEVSRRMEFGLACSCLSEDIYAKIKSQVVVNTGIREESSRRDGGDSFSSAHSFVPLKFVQYLKALAKDPLSGTDQLEFVITRSQLLSYNRWKGYYQLPTLEVLDGLPENDDDVPVSGKAKGPDEVIEYAVPASEGYEQVSSGKGKPIIRDSSSRKRKDIYEDGLFLRKKEKRMSDLMSESCSSLPNGENKSEAKVAGKMSSSSSGNKRKAVDFVSNDSRVKTRKSRLSSGTVSKMPSSPPRYLFRVGERLHRVASQLSGSTPILKHGDKTSQKPVRKNGGKSTGVSLPITEKSEGEKVIPTEYLPSDEILSQLCLIARDPMEGYGFLNSIVSFFSSFRNSLFQESSDSRRDKKSNGNVSDKLRGKNSSNSETTETFEFEGMEDSYWTDRIIQGNPEEQVLFEPEVAIDPNLETADVNLEPESENPVGHLDEKFKVYSPTALILNFTDLDSVPSETNLNKIFSRYGPLNESETEVLKKSNRAKVVFTRRLDAETAFSSAGKFSIFGPSLVSYRLNYSPTPRKASTPAKRNRKDTTASGKSIRFED